jgi:hypothetical protein
VKRRHPGFSIGAGRACLDDVTVRLPIIGSCAIRPGDTVTVVLRGTRFAFPSVVDEAGNYTGRGAVARRAADVVSVEREYTAGVGTVEAELLEQLHRVHAELDALRGVVSRPRPPEPIAASTTP